jgi:hypothetical protein
MRSALLYMLFPLLPALSQERAAYVPAPVPAKTEYLVGAHYFPGWKQGTHYGWSKVVPFPDRTPLLGYYDEGSPEVADWEIKWALEHGIRYFVYCWYRGTGNKGKPAGEQPSYLGHAIHDGLFRARFAKQFQFAIMWENQNPARGVASKDDLLDNLLGYWIEDYFKKPSYLKLGGKPVLFVYHLQRLMEDLGGVENVRGAMEAMRERCRKAGLPGLVVMAEYRGDDIAVLKRIRDCGFDASFAYCWNTKQQRPAPEEAIARQMDLLQLRRAAADLPFIPTATMGWDPLAWQSDNPKAPWLNPEKMVRWRLSPEEFQRLLIKIKTVMDSLPGGSPGRQMLLMDNWNEWGEGHFLAPHAGAGFGYLKAVREVFSQRNNRPDYRSPYEVGLGPYDSQYRKNPAAGQAK